MKSDHFFANSRCDKTDLGRLTTESARKQRTSRCLGLASGKQVKIGNVWLSAHRASRFSLGTSTSPPYGTAPNLGAKKPMGAASISIGVTAGFEPLAGSPNARRRMKIKGGSAQSVRRFRIEKS